jgi:Rrf2 family transcriptional regulator, cysteine metabolism repressor
MKISTRGRYGLRAMMDLATSGKNGAPVYLSDIAKRQAISEKYLEHIFGALQKAGIVKAVRGRKGGYFLTKLPDQITVGDILNVLEGPCHLVHCVTDASACPRTESCATRDIWMMLGNKIEEALSSLTLASVVELQREKSEKNVPMYHI